MDALQLLAGGFAAAMQPTNLLFAVIGCVLGTLVGVLPGLGPAAGIAILIPITFNLDPTPAIIMMAAIYYGAMYGGTITSVLINTPGEAASAVTCLDGYEMAKQGRAGAALAIAAIGSFVGGSIAVLGLVFLAIPLTRLALMLGSPETFALIVLALSLVTGLGGKSIVRSLISALIGFLLATWGIDPGTGTPRLAFGKPELMDGIEIVSVVMGMFGIGEILLNAEQVIGTAVTGRVSSLALSAKDMKDSVGPILRGTGIGFFFGIVPGLGAMTAAFMSYIAEKRVSKTPEKFGTGMIEGVAGPETANNACATAAMIPMFTLGIPGSSAAAILMGALIIHGLTPGPLLFKDHPDFVWTVIASMYIGNVVLVILNLPLIQIWISILKVPYSILFAVILLFCLVGAFSLNSSVFDMGVLVVFGILGYAFKKLDFPIAPLVLTLILGPLMERGLRQSLQGSAGDFSVFFTRPVTAVLLALSLLVLVSSGMRLFSRQPKSEAT